MTLDGIITNPDKNLIKPTPPEQVELYQYKEFISRERVCEAGQSIGANQLNNALVS